MTNGNIATLGRRLAKLENSQWGARANLGDYRAPSIVVREGEDADQITKEMEARGEIPPPESFPPGHVRVVIWRIERSNARRKKIGDADPLSRTAPHHILTNSTIQPFVRCERSALAASRRRGLSRNRPRVL
jgi:hypothetical protein